MTRTRPTFLSAHASLRRLTLAFVAWALVAPTAWAQPDEVTSERLTSESNPAVRAALELPREAPADYVRAVVWLLDLGRPELAAPIFGSLAALPLDDAQHAELAHEFGTQRMMQIARAAALAPAGREFADACLDAAAAAARDPQRLARLTEQLANPQSEFRKAALVDLASTGMVGVRTTLEAFAQAQDPQRRARLMAALLEMSPLVDEPLLAMLSTDDLQLKSDVIELLKRLQNIQALPLIAAATATTPNETALAEERLMRAIGDYQFGMQAFAADPAGQVDLWQWSDDSQQLTKISVPVEAAQADWLARLALALVDLRPENQATQRLALRLGLEAKANLPSTVTPHVSLAKLADAADAEALNEILKTALAERQSGAAVAAIEFLAQRGDASLLQSTGGQPAPLADALLAADRRVRFAALQTIFVLDPQTPFAGSSRVADTLGYFATGAGERQAVVAMPNLIKSTALAGRLTALGLVPMAVDRGADAVNAARASADVELLLIDANVGHPDVRDVVYALRIHPETADLPIAVLATDGRLEAAKRVAADHRRVWAVPRPDSHDSTAAIIEKLVLLAGPDAVPADQRLVEAAQALRWITKELARERSIYELRRLAPKVEMALTHPELAEDSIAALSRLGTPTSQLALADYANWPSLSLEHRLLAVEAFGRSVRTHGLLLTSGEILHQYDRYNASATAELATQQVLGALLDAIESVRSQ